jgi:hypothetical protein
MILTSIPNHLKKAEKTNGGKASAITSRKNTNAQQKNRPATKAHQKNRPATKAHQKNCETSAEETTTEETTTEKTT